MVSSTTNTYLGVFGLLFLFGGAIAFTKYTEQQERRSNYASEEDYSKIQNFLLNEKQIDELGKSSKPILWIHVPLEYNARNWQSFGSRSSYDLNQPYLYLTVRSIITHCDDSFKICIIDDASFKKLIPGMNIDMSRMSEPMVGYVRQLLLANLVYKYGGMVTPISFLCFKDMIGLYDKGIRSHSMFVCENMNTNVSASHMDFFPDARFMGGRKNSSVIKDYMDFMQRQISHDYTSQIDFLGEFNRWCQVRPNKIRVISGMDVGTKTLDDGQVTVDVLLGSNNDVLDFYGHVYGIWIPADDILKRTHYEWFARMSMDQVVTSNTVLGKYILLANSPDKYAVTETLATQDDQDTEREMENKRPNWISFWKTPSGVNIWGPKPQYLGNTVPRADN